MIQLTTKKRFALVLCSALLLSLGWLGFSGVTLLVALVPLLILSEAYSSSARDWWRMAGYMALTCLVWHAATVWWVWNATPIGPIAATIIGTWWNMIAFMTFHFVSKRAPRALAYTLLVALWIATESLYNSAEVLSFPWLLLGNGFSNDIALVQWYEYTGVFGGTLWVLASNLAIYEILRTKTKSAKVRAALIALVPMLLSIALFFGYTPSERTAKVSVIQPNIPCYLDERKAAGKDNALPGVQRLMAQVEEDVAYVVMPESALSYLPHFNSINEDNTEQYKPLLTALRGNAPERTKLITGASSMRLYGESAATETAREHNILGYYDLFNSALLVDSEGDIEKIYHKGKLVVGVEAVPMRKLFKYFEVDLGGISGQLGWGTEHTIFENDSVKIGPSICYEGIYGEYFGGFARRGAELMALISNDGWWGNTPGHKRLFDFSRLRAIESRRSIARSANTGISGFISPRGKTIGKRLEWNEEGVLTAELELRNDLTIYTRYGDWVARIAGYVAVLALMYFVAYRVRRRNNLVD
ncbi:MAG: apolipoprotein N-acyltransferase [Alistipes sp.]|nr:apolipoprotein N-acyltransferase [Alistipes sp.]